MVHHALLHNEHHKTCNGLFLFEEEESRSGKALGSLVASSPTPLRIENAS